MSETPKAPMRVQYSGKQYGKSMQQAMELAERAREFTSVEISVMPHEDYLELQRELAEHKAERERFSRYASKWPSVDAIIVERDELARENERFCAEYHSAVSDNSKSLLAIIELKRENEELRGVLALKDDAYVKQVGTWKIIQRLEEERDEARQKLAELTALIAAKDAEIADLRYTLKHDVDKIEGQYSQAYTEVMNKNDGLRARLNEAKVALEKIEHVQCELQQGKKPHQIARECLEKINE